MNPPGCRWMNLNAMQVKKKIKELSVCCRPYAPGNIKEKAGDCSTYMLPTVYSSPALTRVMA